MSLRQKMFRLVIWQFLVFVILLSGFDAAVGETSTSAPLAQPPPLSRGGFGMSVKFPLNEQSLFVSWAVVLRCPGQRQLDKVRCPEAAVLCSGALFFASFETFSVQLRAARTAKGSPARGAGKAGRL